MATTVATTVMRSYINEHEATLKQLHQSNPIYAHWWRHVGLQARRDVLLSVAETHQGPVILTAQAGRKLCSALLPWQQVIVIYDMFDDKLAGCQTRVLACSLAE
jgi:hypothetical protein